MFINIEKAYVLGLLMGGGELSKSTFQIILPFKKWGMRADVMGEIATDILTDISGKFVKAYKINVSYKIENQRWKISPIGQNNLEEMFTDLSALNLPIEASPLNSINLTVAKQKLTQLEVESFLTGIFDARASLTESHRRFIDDAPIVSLEIPGSTQNFTFVQQICEWLTDLGSVTDQILYNHPCQHSAFDPKYKSWRKGFKIRFLAKSFIRQHSFAFRAKTYGITQLEKKQKVNQQRSCADRKPKKISPISIHDDIKAKDLPLLVRGKMFFHYHHFCAVLGCKYAPIKHLKPIIARYRDLVSIFPKLSKGAIESIEIQFDEIKNNYFASKKFDKKTLSCEKVLQLPYYSNNYSNLETALAYLFSKELNGKRHVGPQKNIIKNNLKNTIIIKSIKGVNLGPILIYNKTNGRSAILSSEVSDDVSKIMNNIVKKSGNEIIVL